MQEVKLLEEGVYFDLPFSTYLALPYVSKSYLQKLKKCPANTLRPTKVTTAMISGRALHTFTMEPHLFKGEFYSIDNEIGGSSKIAERQKANAILDNPGKTFIPATGDESSTRPISMETLVGMKTSIFNHPSARKFLTDCWFEVTLIWDHVLPNGSKIRMKARIDFIPKRGFGIAGDLKSAREADDIGFRSAVTRLGYHMQEAIYMDALNTLFALYQEQGREFPFPEMFDVFVFIAVEKQWPYMCECHELEPYFRELGQNEYHRLLEVERSCREAKGGPFYPAYRNAGVNTLDVPNYLRPQT